MVGWWDDWILAMLQMEVGDENPFFAEFFWPGLSARMPRAILTGGEGDRRGQILMI